MHDLKTLMLSFHPVIAIETVEEQRVERVVADIADDLGVPVFDWTVTRGLTKRGNPQAIHGTVEPLGLVRHLKDLTVMAIFHLKDYAKHLDNPTVVRQFREVADRFAETRSTLVLSGAPITLPPDVDHVTVRYALAPPSQDELRDVIQPVLRSLALRNNVELAVTPSDIDTLLDAMAGMTLNQARQAVAYAGLIDGQVTASDVERILERKTHMIRDGGLLEFFPPDDNHQQLGGFDNLKSWLDRARVGFSEEARQLNLSPPRGILLVGVQGCGKSLAAKVIARLWKLPLLKLDAGRLYDKYIGESEKNLRKAIALAESMAPAVLWLDEIEKMLPSGSGSENDGGVSQRLFASFLTWLQEKTATVFVVATANNLTETPPELLRKGRFDEIFFVDLPTAAARAQILDIHLGLRKQTLNQLDADALIAATEGFSGAEIEQAVIGALYRALHAKRSLDTPLLLQELTETVPLSRSRREDVERLRTFARNRFVPVT